MTKLLNMEQLSQITQQKTYLVGQLAWITTFKILNEIQVCPEEFLYFHIKPCTMHVQLKN